MGLVALARLIAPGICDAMKVVVTGGAGFIGSALTLRLHQGGADVVVVDKLTYAANPHSLGELTGSPRFELINQDICDAGSMVKLFARIRPTYVYHLAAESHVDRSITGSQAFLETNIMGTYSLLEAARGYWGGLPSVMKDTFRFLHVSTDEVYGSLGDRKSVV